MSTMFHYQQWDSAMQLSFIACGILVFRKSFDAILFFSPPPFFSHMFRCHFGFFAAFSKWHSVQGVRVSVCTMCVKLYMSVKYCSVQTRKTTDEVEISHSVKFAWKPTTTERSVFLRWPGVIAKWNLKQELHQQQQQPFTIVTQYMKYIHILPPKQMKFAIAVTWKKWQQSQSCDGIFCRLLFSSFFFSCAYFA